MDTQKYLTFKEAITVYKAIIGRPITKYNLMRMLKKYEHLASKKLISGSRLQVVGVKPKAWRYFLQVRLSEHGRDGIFMGPEW